MAFVIALVALLFVGAIGAFLVRGGGFRQPTPVADRPGEPGQAGHPGAPGDLAPPRS